MVFCYTAHADSHMHVYAGVHGDQGLLSVICFWSICGGIYLIKKLHGKLTCLLPPSSQCLWLLVLWSGVRAESLQPGMATGRVPLCAHSLAQASHLASEGKCLLLENLLAGAASPDRTVASL